MAQKTRPVGQCPGNARSWILARALLYAGSMIRTVARFVLLLSALLLAGLLGPACSLRPQPEPPPVDPGPVIDADLLTATPTSPSAMVSGNIEGAPGASPAGALLRGYNLERSDAPAETVAAPDGSFLLLLDVIEGEEVRLEVLADEARSKPLDVIIGSGISNPTRSVRALADCLSIAPALELDLGQVGSAMVERNIVIANGCSFEVTVGAVGMRAPMDGLTVTFAQPMPIASGASAPVLIQYQAPTGLLGAVEDVLLIEVVAPQRDRRPITIFAEPVP